MKMVKLTEKYIFTCKLKGERVIVGAEVLYHKGILELLTNTGVWEKDVLGTRKFFNEYCFTILYPTWIIEDDGNVFTLGKGDRHTVCL